MNKAELGGGWVGRMVDGRYPLLRWLGGTESGGVFLTETPDQGPRQAAIRLVLAESEDARKRAAGWQAAVGFEHPHLARVLETGECQVDDAAVLYCVTEYADEVLGEVIRERALTPGEAREMLEPLVDALEYLHGQGFVHEGLRPAKILAVNDSLKLSPDGVQRAGTADRVGGADAGGSADAYDTPEAAGNTPAGDVWRLGVTLVEALTQRTPEWEAPGGGVPALLESLPAPFARIARECLQGDPAKRCTLARVRELLAGSAEAGVGQYRRPEHKADRGMERGPAAPAKRSGARQRAWIAGLVLLGLCAAVGVWLHARHPAGQGEIAARQRGHGARTVAAPKQHGAVLARVMPDVPEQAMQTIHGTVMFSVRVTVNAEGAVNSAAIDQAGTSPYFLPFALKAARQWRFVPAFVGGQAVPSTWVLHFVLQKSGIEVHPEEVAP